MSILTNYYIINTFKSETENNYNIAIRYYKLRTKFLLDALQKQIQSQFASEMKEIPNIEELFNEAFANYNANFQPLWESIYSKQYNQEQLASKLEQWKQISQEMEESLQGAAYTVKFLEHLANSDGSNFNLQNTSGIDFSTIEKTENRILRREFQKAKSFGGARGRYFGEIFEQGAGLTLQNSLGSLMQILQLGGEKSKSAANLGKITYGKTDYGFFGFNASIESDESLGNVIVDQSTGEVIPMEAVEAIDLGEKSIDEILSIYTSGSRGLIAGATMKQWTDAMITNVSRTSGGSFGRSQLSASYVNKRQPEGIADNFSNRIVFEDYTAYAISRFLLNIIGIYNIMVASGSHLSFTHDWLQSMQNSARLVHTIKDNGNGKFMAHPAIKVVKI